MNRALLVMPFLAAFIPLTACADVDAVVGRLLLLDMDDLMSLKVRISTNSDRTLSKAPSVVSVITAEDIKATGATNLTEILQSVPGIYVRANLFGFRPQVTFRGASGTHTLLMVNGVPMRDLVWSAGIFWKGLPTHMIERVEIIRGPGSALFGSDASAGVINVITKTARRIERAEAGLRVGSFDSQTGWVQHAGNWNGFEVGLTGQLSHTGGHDPFIARDGEGAFGHAHYGWDAQDLRLSLARGNWRLLADYMGHDNLETGLTGAAVLDPLTHARDRRYDLSLLYNDETFAQDWGVSAELRYSHLGYASGDGFQERPPGYLCVAPVDCNGGTAGLYPGGLINMQEAAERRYGFEASGLYTGINKHAIRLGGGYFSQDLYSVEHWVNYGLGPTGIALPAGGPLVNISDSPYAFAPEKPRRIGYLFLQDIWTITDDWELTAGVRHDHYSDFGSALNPRLALFWQSTDRLSAKLMYGKAFRAPSYLELYSRTAANTPNPDLTPERSNTWDLSFTYLASRALKLDLALYRFSQTDIIAQDPLGKFQNGGDLDTQGAELEAQWQATKTLRMTGNLTHMDGKDSRFRSRTIPKDKAYLRADWAFRPDWNWNVQANWIGRRELPAGNVRAPLDAYTLVDTTIRYFHRGDWEFSASIRNLFDEDAREYSSASIPDNLPLPRRSFYAEISLKH